MSLPFTRDDFFSVFGRYNEAVWPAPLLLYALAVLVLFAASRQRAAWSRTACVGVALLWAWMGGVYHWIYFTPINPAARVFGALFLVEAGLFLWLGAVQGKLVFSWPDGWRRTISMLVLAYGLLVYPLLNVLLGHHFPRTPTFGLPCPTTIFTFGLLWWLRHPFPATIFLIPWAWAVVGGSAAFVLDVPQDLGLLAAAALSLANLVPPGGFAGGRGRSSTTGASARIR